MDLRQTAGDYSAESTERVCQALLHVATILGDWMNQITVIGGIVPSLSIPTDTLPPGAELHPGTTDLDLGLELSILNDEGYASIAELLRGAGYRPVEKSEDIIRRQTWRTDRGFSPAITIDFMVARSPRLPRTQPLQPLERDFAALIADGLQLVSRDRQQIVVSGKTLRGERTERLIHICGPASFVVLKGRAIHLREKPKDAFDLSYILRNHPVGLRRIASSLASMLDDPDAREALEYLRLAFGTVDSIGPQRTANFLLGERNIHCAYDFDYQAASSHAVVQRFLNLVAN
jgi:hypothetical protein